MKIYIQVAEAEDKSKQCMYSHIKGTSLISFILFLFDAILLELILRTGREPQKQDWIDYTFLLLNRASHCGFQGVNKYK